MLNKIVKFINEILKNNLGSYDVKAEKVSVGWKIYWLIGILILCIIIPVLLIVLEVYLKEVLLWNPLKLENREINNVIVSIYFLSSFVSGITFLRIGYLTTYRINGSTKKLSEKKTLRWVFLCFFLLLVVFYIVALLFY